VNFQLNWRGPQVAAAVNSQVVAPLLGEIGLAVEREGKLQLYAGHGLISGALRSSIHTAEPGYNWNADNVDSLRGAPQRGGKLVAAAQQLGKLVVQVGSGMVYAMAIHQGWPQGYPGLRGSFAGYHYLTNAVERVRPLVASMAARHRLK